MNTDKHGLELESETRRVIGCADGFTAKGNLKNSCQLPVGRSTLQRARTRQLPTVNRQPSVVK